MIVFDANVLAKLFIKEVHSEAVPQLVEQCSRIFAPELIRLEVSGAIIRSSLAADLPHAEISEKLLLWREFIVLHTPVLVPDRILLTDAEQLAVELGHPVADCLYLVLARREDIPFVTDDKKLLAAARDRFPKMRSLASCLH